MFFKVFFLMLIFNCFKVNCFRPDKFCFLIDSQNIICKKHQCEENLCSMDKKSCINLGKWHNLVSNHTREKIYGEFHNFFAQIKECKKIDYIRLSPIVCSNKLKCDSKKQSFFRNIIGLKPKECFCFGKFKYDCGNEMCAINKKTCEFLFIANKNYLTNKIKKCF